METSRSAPEQLGKKVPRLALTIDLSQGAYLELREAADGTTQICVRAGQGNRMRYTGEHKAKFNDLLAVLQRDRVKEAAEYLAAQDALK